MIQKKSALQLKLIFSEDCVFKSFLEIQAFQNFCYIKLEVLDNFNPLQRPSGLYRCLKAKYGHDEDKHSKHKSSHSIDVRSISSVFNTCQKVIIDNSVKFGVNLVVEIQTFQDCCLFLLEFVSSMFTSFSIHKP